MTRRFDNLPAPTPVPRVCGGNGVPSIEGFDVKAEPSGRATMVFRLAWNVWLTRDALLEAAPRLLTSPVREDREAARAWIVRDTADQVGSIRRTLRERREGAR
ncbi:MAG: hypothetical protein DI607_03415 [Sphingomonas hengshuiensis]|nr:MAG: hypothetical protein DI607_03415 [Sphingomonas hengshuiensis]